MTCKVEIQQDFPFPVDKVFADLADHALLGRILGVPMVRIVDGSEGGKSGLGSVRRVGPAMLDCEETIITYKENELIEYKVTKGGPTKNHLGRMMFSATPNGSRLHYVVTFDGKLPLIGSLLARVLQKGASKALARYAQG